ncbi:MAG TPA: cytochrome c oxidase subunit 4 [Acidimicrobiales bacterium]|nr:cytochrome c oxidase subunit 4 [Acidimicrobiales bacterium]
MKTESVLLLAIGLIFGMVAVVYWAFSYEDAGFLLLIGTCFLGLLPGLYYYYWYRRTGARPEDRDDAEIADGAGVVDAFPDSSIWPFLIGMGAFLCLLAFVFGYWLAFPGIALVVSAVTGATAESRRGGNV